MGIPKKHPFAFGVGFALVKTSGIDLLVQKVVEKKKEIDWRRNATFSAFGFFCLGGIQYGLYVKVFGRVFPNAAAFAAKPLKEKLKDVRGMANVGAQTFLDQCCYHPFVYFPIFYCTKEAVMSDKPSISNAMATYRTNFTEDIKALWKVWVPFTMINFSFMPMHLRVPFTAVVSMVWTCILSAMRGGDVMNGDEMAGGAVTGATMSIMTEVLEDYFTCPVELDRELNHICISASGPDRVGYVAKLARAVADQGGNVTYSNQVRLGQEFVILMHVAVPPEKTRTLISAMKTNKSLKPLDIQTRSLMRRGTGTYEKPVLGLKVHCVGVDQPGMLASIAEKLAEKGLSMEQVNTELRRSTRKGKPGVRQFVINADCTTTDDSGPEGLNELMTELSHLKEELGLDVVDVRVHRI